MDIALTYSQRERYELQPSKSMILPIGNAVPLDLLQEWQPWSMGNHPVQVVEEATHLGLQIDSSTGGITASITSNIKKAQRAIYGLMGAGLHGKNGVPPKVAITLYKIYILPILLYGMEVLLPSGKELERLANFHRKMLIQLCSLAENVAHPAPFIITGILPAEGLIHKKALIFLRTLSLKEGSIERRLIERQTIMKEKSSWVTRVMELTHKYDLPAVEELLQSLKSKEEWAKVVNKQVSIHCWRAILDLARLYPSLRFLSTSNCAKELPHPLIQDVRSNLRDTYRCMIKLRMVTGTYHLQTNRARFNQLVVDKTCLLCKKEPETRVHLLALCPALEEYRNYYRTCCPVDLPQTPEIWTQVVLDASSDLLQDRVDEDQLPLLEYWGRRYCYTVHAERAKRIATLPTRKRFGL